MHASRHPGRINLANRRDETNASVIYYRFLHASRHQGRTPRSLISQTVETKRTQVLPSIDVCTQVENSAEHHGHTTVCLACKNGDGTNTSLTRCRFLYARRHPGRTPWSLTSQTVETKRTQVLPSIDFCLQVDTSVEHHGP